MFGWRRSQNLRAQVFVLEMEIVLTPTPLLVDILVTESESVGVKMRPKEEEFHNSSSLFAFVPFVVVNYRIQVMKVLHLPEQYFSQVAFLLDSCVHVMFAHTHMHASQKPLILLLVDGRRCIPCFFFCLFFFIPLCLLILTCIFPPMQLKALGW